MLAGAPPFAGSTRAGVLHKVLHEEPPPLRRRLPQLPRDLETIALKCLHKEPERRYATARALAEDLGRFLDGEPIFGRRPGPVERLARAARRNRALAAVVAASLAIVLALGAFGARAWLDAKRARAQSAERARLAESLGQQVKEAEWFLRAAYALPLHDTSPEQQRVRGRMARLVERASEPGGFGEGLAHYAVGRGHLALGEYEPARAELARAASLGVDSPELHLALGRALGELYRRALDDARRSGGAEWVAGRRPAFEREFLEPALAELEKGRGAELESPRYLEGLIAFYRRDYDAAERAAEQAAAEAPWAYEARKLAADVALARAVERLERGDYEAARAGLGRAAARYERASEAGRSDAPTYEALAEAWLQRAELDRRQGRPPGEALGRALAAAGQAVEAAPGRASGHARRAQALMRRYEALRTGGGPELERTMAEWVAAAERAVALDPRDVYAHDALGNANYYRGHQEARAGRDPMRPRGDAIAQLSRALELAPNYPWALNDLARVHPWRGNVGRQNGRDPRADYAEAERHLRRAIDADPAYLFAFENLTDLYGGAAAYALSRGLDPRAEVEKAVEMGGRALALDGRHVATLTKLALAELTQAQYLDDAGADPGPAVERAFAHLERSRVVNPSSDRAALYRADGHRLVARHVLRAGGDARGPLEAARAALDDADRATADCVDCAVVAAQLGLLEADRAGRRGRSKLPALRRAQSEARRAVAAYPYVDAHQELARACLRLAEALPPPEAAAALDEGAKQADLALGLDPYAAQAHAVRGALLLLRARTAGDVARRRALSRDARAAFARALELNPFVRREYESYLREAEAPAP